MTSKNGFFDGDLLLTDQKFTFALSQGWDEIARL